MKHSTIQDHELADLYLALANSCTTGKIKFKKRQHAQSEATHLNKTLPLKGPKIFAEAYRCNNCGYWHVGRPRR